MCFYLQLNAAFSRGRSVRQRLAQYSTAMEAIQARSEPLELDNEDIPWVAQLPQ